MQTCDTVANKPFKVGIKAAFKDYLFEEYTKWVALNPDSETRGQWNPKFTLGALKEKITGFVSVAMDTLKTPAMMICIANSFATDGRFALIRSDDRQALAALGGLTIEVDHMNGVEPENSGDVIHVDDDSAFSAYRDNAEDSDSSDVEG